MSIRGIASTKEIAVVLDESGNIHKNSSCRYFAIDGYRCFKSDFKKTSALYRRENKIREEKTLAT